MSATIAAQQVLAGKLSPEAEQLLNMIRTSGFPGWSVLGIEHGRAAIAQMKALSGVPESVGGVKDIEITAIDGSAIPARLYIPASPDPPPVMVYLHGGGWVLGDYTSVDPLLRRLANVSGCAMLSVDYRLAPEHKYPVALEDVMAALAWVAKHGPEWGVDSSRLAIGGDSSGANLAAAATLRSRDERGPTIAFQMLVYPALDCDYKRSSYQQFGDGALSALSTADVAWFHSQYVSSSADLEGWGVSPLRAESLERLPPTLLICAELDPLIDEIVEFARRLEDDGVPVHLRIYAGMFHGFWRMGGVLTEARNALDYAAGEIRAAMTVQRR
jgi:acetyl esterase